jgi:hypothetical protein
VSRHETRSALAALRSGRRTTSLSLSRHRHNGVGRRGASFANSAAFADELVCSLTSLGIALRIKEEARDARCVPEMNSGRLELTSCSVLVSERAVMASSRVRPWRSSKRRRRPLPDLATAPSHHYQSPIVVPTYPETGELSERAILDAGSPNDEELRMPVLVARFPAAARRQARSTWYVTFFRALVCNA